MHMPLLQVWLVVVQLVELVQVPPLHVWMVLPEHCTEPGEQDPVHWPMEHVELVHGVVIPH